MSDRLLELAVGGLIRAAGCARALSERAREERGQGTVEWIALMVFFVALITLVAGSDVWRQAGQAVVDAADQILSTPASDEKV